MSNIDNFRRKLKELLDEFDADLGVQVDAKSTVAIKDTTSHFIVTIGEVDYILTEYSFDLYRDDLLKEGKDTPGVSSYYGLDEVCDDCGGNMTWCTSCEVWSKGCCNDYGTCMCG